jgi:hypothetical protein
MNEEMWTKVALNYKLRERIVRGRLRKSWKENLETGAGDKFPNT